MREIKFRALCEIGDKIEMLIFQKGQYDNGLWFTSLNHVDEYISPLMQYTGLKDKNGVEIYEGDIIAANNELYYVAWDNNLCCYHLYTKLGLHTSIIGRLHNCEIVGNIHANPELLGIPTNSTHPDTQREIEEAFNKQN